MESQNPPFAIFKSNSYMFWLRKKLYNCWSVVGISDDMQLWNLIILKLNKYIKKIIFTCINNFAFGIGDRYPKLEGWVKKLKNW
jgi:hypothetical protein